MTDMELMRKEIEILQNNVTKLNLENAKLSGQIKYLENAHMTMEHKIAHLTKKERKMK